MRMVLMILVMLLTACGGYETKDNQAGPAPVPTPQPTPGPGPGPGAVSFADVTQIMNQYCVDCHAGAAFTKSEQAFRAGSAKARVQNGTMPPPYAPPMDAASKQKFLSF